VTEFSQQVKYLICISFLVLTGCDGLPLRVPNDTSQTIRIDIHDRRLPTAVELEERKPGEVFGTRRCWKDSDAILLSTRRYPDPIVFDPKKFCDLDYCDCEILVSKLVRQTTPAMVLKNQQDVCAGRGPFLQPDVRTQLCTVYVARTVGDRTLPLPYETDPAMLAP